MNIRKPTKIVVIHDDVSEGSPIMVTLEMEFEKENVMLFKHSQQGLDYVLANLGEKMIVLLDKNFYEGKEKSGIKVFEEIRAKTALVYVIMTSVSNLSDFGDENLKAMINQESFAFESFTSDYSEIIKLIKLANEKMSLQIDAVIEDWILRHPVEKRTQALIKTKDGREYSMNDILDSIRQQTTIGINFEKDLLRLAIEMFSRQKLKVDD